MSVLIVIEPSKGKIKKASFEAVNYGARIAASAGVSAHALMLTGAEGSEPGELGKAGAASVLILQQAPLQDTQWMSAAIVAAAEKTGAKTIVFSHDYTGKALAPRVAARLKAGLVAGAVGNPVMNGNAWTVPKNVFSGKALAHYVIESDYKVISLLPNTFPVDLSSQPCAVEQYNPQLAISSRVKLIELKTVSNELSLAEAEKVVSAGRGLKGPENWGIIEDLAKELGAATACSRPVADIGWRPHHEHVGQTGIAIRPNLYFAIGISGAIQHLAGVNGSKTIVVINKDAEAPFFKSADYGVVGDAFEVVPKITEALKKFKASHH